MENSAATKKLMEKMLEATFAERFSRKARRYDRKLVFRIWAQLVRSGGIKEYLSQYEWNSHVKILEALDYMDDYCDSVEAMIRAKMWGVRNNRAPSINARSRTERNIECRRSARTRSLDDG